MDREVEALERHLPSLATIGSTAPFVGLFGTVWGIMNSFQSIAVTKNTTLAVVAPGIAEALFATALGLLAAIPAVIAYNKLSGELDRYANRLASFADEFAVVLSRELDAGQGGLNGGGRRSRRASRRARRGRRRRRRRPMAEINVTPMVDVMLVLLIVFMVTAPLLTTGVAVDLPQAAELAAAGPGRAAERHGRRPGGKIYVQDSRDPARPARPAARGDHAAASPDARIFVRGDRGDRLRLGHGGGRRDQPRRLQQGGAGDRQRGGPEDGVRPPRRPRPRVQAAA